jgi:hypothetical protein
VVSSSSNGFGGGSAAGVADGAAVAGGEIEGIAAATPASIPEFKNPRRFSLEEMLNLFIWSKVFDLLTSEFQNSNGKRSTG